MAYMDCDRMYVNDWDIQGKLDRNYERQTLERIELLLDDLLMELKLKQPVDID